MPEGKIKYAMAKPPDAKELPVPTDLFILHMNYAFGKFPLELGEDQVERLEGMKSTWNNQIGNPYDVLIRAVKKYGSIRVWVEYPPSADTVRAVLEKEAAERKE